MRQLTRDQFKAELQAQGVPDKEDYAFKCCICGTIQSMRDLYKAGCTEAQTTVGFACVGRFTGAGPHPKGGAPGKGCDWSLGGLFRFHDLEVLDPEGGKPHPFFELATPAEAQAHARTHLQSGRPL